MAIDLIITQIGGRECSGVMVDGKVLCKSSYGFAGWVSAVCLAAGWTAREGRITCESCGWAIDPDGDCANSLCSCRPAMKNVR